VRLGPYHNVFRVERFPADKHKADIFGHRTPGIVTIAALIVKHVVTAAVTPV
jgi:hypothetical protein